MRRRMAGQGGDRRVSVAGMLGGIVAVGALVAIAIAIAREPGRGLGGRGPVMEPAPIDVLGVTR